MYSNLSSAQLGGVPGTFNLVRSFLNIKHPTSAPGLDDGLVEGVPVWPMIFYCLRCGDIAAALQAATAAGPALQEAITLLRELSSSAGNTCLSMVNALNKQFSLVNTCRRQTVHCS